jgi:hypothetical protein
VKRFSEERENVTDEERSGRPTTSRTEAMEVYRFAGKKQGKFFI